MAREDEMTDRHACPKVQADDIRDEFVHKLLARLYYWPDHREYGHGITEDVLEDKPWKTDLYTQWQELYAHLDRTIQMAIDCDQPHEFWEAIHHRHPTRAYRIQKGPQHLVGVLALARNPHWVDEILDKRPPRVMKSVREALQDYLPIVEKKQKRLGYLFQGLQELDRRLRETRPADPPFRVAAGECALCQQSRRAMERYADDHILPESDSDAEGEGGDPPSSPATVRAVPDAHDPYCLQQRKRELDMLLKNIYKLSLVKDEPASFRRYVAYFNPEHDKDQEDYFNLEDWDNAVKHNAKRVLSYMIQAVGSDSVDIDGQETTMQYWIKSMDEDPTNAEKIWFFLLVNGPEGISTFVFLDDRPDLLEKYWDESKEKLGKFPEDWVKRAIQHMALGVLRFMYQEDHKLVRDQVVSLLKEDGELNEIYPDAERTSVVFLLFMSQVDNTGCPNDWMELHHCDPTLKYQHCTAIDLPDEADPEHARIYKAWWQLYQKNSDYYYRQWPEDLLHTYDVYYMMCVLGDEYVDLFWQWIRDDIGQNPQEPEVIQVALKQDFDNHGYYLNRNHIEERFNRELEVNMALNDENHQ